jgi:predicted nuclease of predicted toxin-antitoxin system
VKGILADNNVIGQVAYLAQLMQSHGWEIFWQDLGLSLVRFQDVGLTAAATDVEIWHCCQAEELILITDNRNDDAPDSLNAAIRQFGSPDSLPIFTIADLDKFGTSREYEEKVVAALYDYLLRIEDIRGVGRLFLP